MEALKNMNETICPYYMVSDILSEEEVKKLSACRPANAERVMVTIGHDTPSGTVAAAGRQKVMKQFARENHTIYWYGRGIGYYIAMEDHLNYGDVILGTGKHITTVGAVGAIGIQVGFEQFLESMKTGTFVLQSPDLYVVELNGEFEHGVTAYDLVLTLLQTKEALKGKLVVFTKGEHLDFADKAAICNLISNAEVFSAVFSNEMLAADRSISLNEITRKAVMPGGFDRIEASKVVDGLRVSQVFVGGCAGGNIETMRYAANALKGKKVNKYVRVLIAPATTKVYEQMIEEKLVEPLLDSGALIMNQGCSACWAKSQGLVDDNEVFVTTGSINCENWAGLHNNKIYITSPKAAVKCALTGNLYEN